MKTGHSDPGTGRAYNEIVFFCRKDHPGELVGRTEEMLLGMCPASDITPHLYFFCGRYDV